MNQDRLATRIAGWSGRAVVTHYDAPSAVWIFIALHSDALGTPTGGTRWRRYEHLDDALADAMRLAQGMTAKWAAVNFPFGGGKAVLCPTRALDTEERRGVMRRYGRLLSTLRGSFATGPDLGTTVDDMREIASQTPYVHGVDRATGVAQDPGPYTAAGVFAAIEAAARQAMGTADVAGLRVLVEGVGSVGAPLARALAAKGARLLLCDLDPARAERLAAELGAGVVALAEVAVTDCDLYAPCAVGGTLNRGSIEQLRCRMVVGSANNQLAELADSQRLAARGILYAPDFIANAGGAIGFAMLGQGASEDTIRTRLQAIGTSLGEIFAEAAAHGETPLAAAERRVERHLAAAG